ncbi:cytochrome P450 [Trametopsis cervina]|nr:cytochrome P450 [Trametopsis cervina]
MFDEKPGRAVSTTNSRIYEPSDFLCSEGYSTADACSTLIQRFQLPVVTLLFLIAAVVADYYFRVYSFDGPPTVWPMIPFLGDTVQYLFKHTHYVEHCRTAYGPIFRCMLGNRSMIVVCDYAGIQAILKDKTRSLSATVSSRDIVRAIGDVDSDIGPYLFDRLVPVAADIFSIQNLPAMLPTVNRVIWRHLESIVKSGRSQTTPLSSFVGEILFSAVTIGVYGDNFPLSALADFEILDRDFVRLLIKVPFLAISARRSRSRLLKVIDSYVESAGPSSGAGVLPEPATKLLNVLADLNISSAERNGVLLLFTWGLHTSLIRTAFWMFAHILNNPDVMYRLRTEIDQALVNEFHSIDSLLDAPPGRLDGESFALLNSLVKEALRTTSVNTPVREACEDMMITLSNGMTYPIRKGEYVAASIPALHTGAGRYENPLEFRDDRFINKDDKKAPYLPWGGGDHICRGRFFSMHVLKMIAILAIHSLDLSVVSPLGSPLYTPFLEPRLTYMKLWQMRPKQSPHICVQRRRGETWDQATANSRNAP